MKMTHFLLTRFNCPIGWWGIKDVGISNDWLMHRFSLFESFCLPSVVAQNDQDFYWIIVIDERTPKRWLTRLENDVSMMMPRVIIKPVIKFSEATITNEIKNVTASESDIIVTTRLDNDDAIARSYLFAIINICKTLTPIGNYVINFRSGCQLHRSGVYLFTPGYLNSFISVMSLRNGLITAFHRNHTKMDSVGTVIDIKADPNDPNSIMWMQVLHTKNAASRLRANTKQIDKERIHNFSIAEKWESVL
jgi:hypothetical protein